MCEPQPSRLCVEVDRNANPIAGEVHASGKRRLLFVRWLGLISALERTIATDQPAQPSMPAIAHVSQGASPDNQQGE